jgi:hypothetical protein
MERRDDARRTPGDRDGGGGVTIGDHMLMRAIDPALVAHPFVCPLPITVGGGRSIFRARSRGRSSRACSRWSASSARRFAGTPKWRS